MLKYLEKKKAKFQRQRVQKQETATQVWKAVGREWHVEKRIWKSGMSDAKFWELCK